METFSKKLPPSVPILYCTGSETKYCISQFCYNSLSLDNQKYTQGCDKKNECSQTGCTLTKNNKFICCCATDNCNDLKMSTLKLYFQDYMSFEENNLEYFSRTIRSKPHLIEDSEEMDENDQIKNKKTPDIIEDEKLILTDNNVKYKVKDHYFENAELTEGSGLESVVENTKTINNTKNYEKKLRTTVDISDNEKDNGINNESTSQNIQDKESKISDIKEVSENDKNNKFISNRLISMIVNPKRSVATVHELIKPYPWYFVTAAGFILSFIIFVGVYMIIKKVKKRDSHEVISQQDNNELEFANVPTMKNERLVLKEIKNEEDVELIDKE
uniref:EB domain-containing protein n=1 Tax=Strongyloides venezuelensis TaxID=75913 RepID=A0A0K0FZ69_STRVS